MVSTIYQDELIISARDMTAYIEAADKERELRE